MSIAWAVLPSIWVAGLIAGLFFGIGIKTGVEPSEEGIGLLLLETFCRATEDMPNSVPGMCGMLILFVTIVSVGVGIMAVLTEVARAGDWRVGAGVYFFGWIITVVVILAS